MYIVSVGKEAWRAVRVLPRLGKYPRRCRNNFTKQKDHRAAHATHKNKMQQPHFIPSPPLLLLPLYIATLLLQSQEVLAKAALCVTHQSVYVYNKASPPLPSWHRVCVYICMHLEDVPISPPAAAVCWQ